VLLDGTARSSCVPTTLTTSGMAITLLSALLTERRLGVLLALTLDSSCIGSSTAIASLGVAILELVVALLESSATAESLLLAVALAVALLAVAGSISAQRSIAHTTVSTAIGIGATETSVSTSVSTATEAATVVTETTTADVGVATDRRSARACHIGSLHTLGSRDNVVLNILTLGKTLKATIVVDGGVMDKNLVHWGSLRAL